MAESRGPGGSGRASARTDPLGDLPRRSTEKRLRKTLVLGQDEHVLEAMSGVLDDLRLNGVAETWMPATLLGVRIPNDHMRRVTWCAYSARGLFLIGSSHLHLTYLTHVLTISAQPDGAVTFVFVEPSTPPKAVKAEWRAENPKDRLHLGGFIERLTSQQRNCVADQPPDQRAWMVRAYSAARADGLLDPMAASPYRSEPDQPGAAVDSADQVRWAVAEPWDSPRTIAGVWLSALLRREHDNVRLYKLLHGGPEGIDYGACTVVDTVTKTLLRRRFTPEVPRPEVAAFITELRATVPDAPAQADMEALASVLLNKEDVADLVRKLDPHDRLLADAVICAQLQLQLGVSYQDVDRLIIEAEESTQERGWTLRRYESPQQR